MAKSSDSSDESSEEKKPKKSTKPAKKRKVESDSGSEDSGPSDKKPKPGKSNGRWQIAKLRRVEVSSFKGKTRVDIREMYLDGSGEEKPGKKGISLSMEEWTKLVEYSKEITDYAKSH